MKKYIIFIVLAMTFNSCSLIRSSSSKTLGVKTDAVYNMVAELEVLPQKAKEIAHLERGLKGKKELKSNAIANTLKDSKMVYW